MQPFMKRAELSKDFLSLHPKEYSADHTRS